MCFSIFPYVWLRVPAYLGTRGLIKLVYIVVVVAVIVAVSDTVAADAFS